MNDTVALHMLGDTTKAAEALVQAENEFNNAQKLTKVAEAINIAFSSARLEYTLPGFQ
jgi:pyridoxal biosynthesis lyase PdxS